MPFRQTALWKRQSNPDDNGGFQPVIYIPVIIVFITIVIVGTATAVHRQRARSANRPARNDSGVVQMTANQLVGSASSQTGPNASQPRRARRNRRRASQISVTSLPLYMEEAGETELVLVRGDRELHDDPPPAGSSDQRATTENEDEDNDRNATAAPSNSAHSVRSYESADSLPEADHVISPLMENHRRTQSDSSAQGRPRSQSVPLEDAPPYEETVSRQTGPGGNSVESSRASTGPSTSLDEGPERQETSSGSRLLPLRAMPNLRSLFTRTPNDPVESHTLASSSSRTHLLSHQRSTSSFSQSSLLHLTPTTSRLSTRRSRHFDERSANASQISLASISAPLQHTLVRTEFSYPKNGPTQEQMKFLGSRESLALFGIPFGSAAVAYSKVEPPSFESLASQASTSQVPVQGSSQVNDRSHDPSSSAPETEDGVLNAQEPEMPERVDSHFMASPTGQQRNTTSVGSAEVIPGETNREENSDISAVPKITVPIISHEPASAPPTPPPTPPRQSLHLVDGNDAI